MAGDTGVSTSSRASVACAQLACSCEVLVQVCRGHEPAHARPRQGSFSPPVTAGLSACAAGHASLHALPRPTRGHGAGCRPHAAHLVLMHGGLQVVLGPVEAQTQLALRRLALHLQAARGREGCGRTSCAQCAAPSTGSDSAFHTPAADVLRVGPAGRRVSALWLRAAQLRAPPGQPGPGAAAGDVRLTAGRSSPVP